MSSLRSKFLRTTYWIKDWVYGSPIRKEYNEIKFIMENPEESKTYKSEKLKSLLKYAVKNCPFYEKIDPTDILNFPIVNKIILTENFKNIAVQADIIPGQKGTVHVQRTSGSTGTPFKVPQDTRKRNHRIAELKYFGELVGYNSHDPLCHLRIWTFWQSKSKLQILRENIYPFNVADMSDANLSKMVELINDKHITAMRSYASSYGIIADYFKRNNIYCPSLDIAISGSEALLDSVRDAVHSYMNCEIISQYADEECGILGQEQRNGKPNCFYLNHASYEIEILKLDEDKPAEYGELGRIVLTDLNNHAFPIIRYDTGDIAILHEPDDTSAYPYLSSLFGRRLDLIYNTNGNPIHPMVLSRVLKNFDEIKQWQFIQKSEKDYLLKLIAEKNINETEIKRSLREYFGDSAHIFIEYVDDIPVLKSGKRKPVVNEWTSKQ